VIARGTPAARELQDRALREVDELVARFPDRSWPHHLAALMLREYGRVDEAARREGLAASLESNPPIEEDLVSEAFLGQERGSHREAVELYTLLIASRPDAPDYYRSRGESLLSLGELERATEDLRLAAALLPRDAYLHFQLWRVLTRRGMEPEAEGHLQQALELTTMVEVVHERAADELLHRGQQAVAAGEPERARSYFVKAERHARAGLDLEPDSPHSLVSLGASLVEQNRLEATPRRQQIEAATVHYRRALELWRATAPENVPAGPYANALANTCDAEIQLGDLERALAVCLEVTEVTPESALGFYNLAGAYALSDRREEALAALERDVELGDRDWAYLAADAWFEKLRGEPRFERLLERMRASDTTR
jgi:tetratricopeptide (TPR) repeat protein